MKWNEVENFIFFQLNNFFLLNQWKCIKQFGSAICEFFCAFIWGVCGRFIVWLKTITCFSGLKIHSSVSKGLQILRSRGRFFVWLKTITCFSGLKIHSSGSKGLQILRSYKSTARQSKDYKSFEAHY